MEENSVELVIFKCYIFRYQFMEENSVSMVQWRLEVSPCDKDVQVITRSCVMCNLSNL